MKIIQKLISLVFFYSWFVHLPAQIAQTKILVLPSGQHHEEVWFKLNEPAFPETVDTVFTKKAKIDFIRQQYSDGSTIISDYMRNNELYKVTYTSKEDNIEVVYKEGKVIFVQPKKWGISDSSSMLYDYLWHGQVITFQNEKVRDIWEYKYGKMQTMSLYANDQLKEKQVYMNGRKDYMRMEYFDNGKVLSSVRFIKGKAHGRANYYFREGENLAELDFKNGKLDKGKIHKSPEDKEGIMVTGKDPDVMWYHCAPDGSFCCECHTRKGKVSCKPIKQKK